MGCNVIENVNVTDLERNYLYLFMYLVMYSKQCLQSDSINSSRNYQELRKHIASSSPVILFVERPTTALIMGAMLFISSCYNVQKKYFFSSKVMITT